MSNIRPITVNDRKAYLLQYGQLEDIQNLLISFFKDTDLNILMSICAGGNRCVEINAAERVLQNGIDVVPTDAPFYANIPQKAIEYGGLNKILLSYDVKQTSRTFLELDAGIEQEKLDEYLKTYPTLEKSTDGNKLWLSRLKLDDRRRATSYEIAYGMWIPGDPWKALMAMIFMVPEGVEISSVLSLNCEFTG